MSINLVKGQKINLQKADGSQLTKVFMGLGWDAATGLFGLGGKIDLDASCAMYSETNQFIDSVSFKQLTSKDGSIRHTGDNLTGDGDGDDEVINVDLKMVTPNVKSIVFTINSFRGQTFDKIKNCNARLVDSLTKQEICNYQLSEKGNHTGLIMCKVYRHNNEWKMSAIGIPCKGTTIESISNEIQQCL